jgi:hypothetical protein
MTLVDEDQVPTPPQWGARWLYWSFAVVLAICAMDWARKGEWLMAAILVAYVGFMVMQPNTHRWAMASGWHRGRLAQDDEMIAVGMSLEKALWLMRLQLALSLNSNAEVHVVLAEMIRDATEEEDA